MLTRNRFVIMALAFVMALACSSARAKTNESGVFGACTPL
jgi:hypothetical protein